MKIALSQFNTHVGHFEHNVSRMISSIEAARAQGADLVVFSELSVCGYPPKDLLEMDEFIQKCLEGVVTIAGHCQGIAAVVGSPSLNKGEKGKKLFNSAFFLQDGKVSQVCNKALLPTYDVFEEYRYFEPATKFQTVAYKGKKIALTVCEDIWNLDNFALYPSSPMDLLIKEEPDLMINIAASPFAWSRVEERMEVLSENSRKYQLPLFYVNQLGGQTDLIFDGGSCVINSKGKMVDSLGYFKEGLHIFELQEVEREPGIPVSPLKGEDEKNALLYDALVMGLRDYFRKSGIKKAILGLSGGLDSALTLVIAAAALGKENLWAVLLPGPFSSDHSVKDAEQLAKNLEVKYDILSINEVVNSLQNSLKPHFKDLPPDIAEENLQARARAIMLMGLSNKFGHMLLNTSNKSEAAVGYGTLYGDMCGGLSVIGDLYKTEVFSLAKYINREKEIIPLNTLNKPPSAELKADQKDADALPEYHILDPILFQYIEKKMSPQQIVDNGNESALVERVIRLVDNSEFKRHQSPPVLRVSQKGFGAGRKLPLVARYPSSWQ